MLDEWLAILSRARSKGDLFLKATCYLMMKAGFSNWELQTLEVRYKKYKRIKKKYDVMLRNIHYEKNDSGKECKDEEWKDNIWVCWLQGFETAPEIVKACLDSVYRCMPEKKVHIISEENMQDYVEFPDYIIEKWKKGVISNTHLSDLLRTELLINYGGMWIDATAYFTDHIPSYVYEKPLFLFHYKVSVDLAISHNNWLIYAQKDNRDLKIVRDLLYEYWKKENKLSEYFLWQLFLNMVFEKYPEDCNNIYYVSDEMAHMLQYNIFQKFDPVYWEQIKRFSVVHKLSYKLNVPEDIHDTYYEYLLQGRLEHV